MAATSFTTLAAAQAAAAEYLARTPWAVSVHTTVGTLAVVIGRDGIVREA